MDVGRSEQVVGAGDFGEQARLRAALTYVAGSLVWEHRLGALRAAASGTPVPVEERDVA